MKKSAVVFQGEPGAFSWTAAGKLLKALGRQTEAVAKPTFGEVFEAVRRGSAQFAVIPIENTLYGSVHENYDHLLTYGFPIVAETTVRIEHNLIALPGVGWRQIRKAYSHPVALGQCRRFFEKHPRIEPIPFYDTAGSVKMLAEEKRRDAGAIASSAAAALYGGHIVKANIEDHRQNFTRFFLLSKQPRKDRNGAAPWKTSVVFSAPNIPGALFRALACFALRDLSLTKIESRPLREKPWEYLFYVDISGDSKTPAVQKALKNLEEVSTFVKVLGTYQPVE
jgi:prephenate dehydratase